jgi:hypothetical protein
MASKADLEKTTAALRANLQEICGGRTPFELKCELLELRRAVELAKRMLAQLDAQDTTVSFSHAIEFRDYIKTTRYI